MNQQTFVFSKDMLSDTEVVCDISAMLKYGEQLVSIVPQAVSPVSTPPLTVEMLNAPAPLQAEVHLILRGGEVNISYGFQLLVTTNARQLTALVAVSVTQDVQVPYQTQQPEAYVCLLYTSPSPRDRQKSRMPSSA